MIRKRKRGKNKDVLITCQYFYPEENSSATLPYDTARFLAEQGYTVGVLCGYPKEYFNGDKVPYEEVVNGIHIRRIPYIQSRRTGKIGRLINYFSFTIGACFHFGMLKDYRCVICYSNPPILPAAAVHAAGRHGAKIIFVSYDVYPEIAYGSNNILKGSFTDRFMRRVNHYVYERADRVIALTEEMRDYILKHRPEIEGDRVAVICNWAHEENEDTESFRDFSQRACEKEAKDSLKHIKISYFGNMGICQDMDTILSAAERTEKDGKIRFELIGTGKKKEDIRRYIADHHLVQTKIFDYMTGDRLRRKLFSSSCCIVSLTEGLQGMCAPSKYYTYLYEGKPVISVMEKNSCISREVVKEKIGFAVENGDAAGFEEAVRFIQNHPEETRKMGERAGELYRRKYRYGLAMDKYKEVVESVLNSK